MDQDLVDRIYECSLVPELWPRVLDELARIMEGSSATLLVTKADIQYWTTSHDDRAGVEKFVNEG